MTKWSMKKERDLMQLARENLSVEQIAAKLATRPGTVSKLALRLGVKLRPIAAKRNGRRKMEK